MPSKLILAAVPTAPLLLPAASPAQPPELTAPVAALRVDVAAALDGLGDTVVAVVAGEALAVVEPARATLRSYGLAIERELASDAALAAAVAAALGTDHLPAAELHGDAAVLALLVTDQRPSVPLVVLEVPAALAASVDEAARVAVAVADAAGVVDGTLAVLAAGDLAATLTTASPGYLVEGAEDHDRAIVAAVRDVDPAALTATSADAERFRTRALPALAVLVALHDREGTRPQELTYHAPRGVGQLVVQPGS